MRPSISEHRQVVRRMLSRPMPVVLLVLALATTALAPAPVLMSGTPATAESTSDTRLFAWGRNHAGQLGTGDVTDRGAPEAVSLPTGVTLVDVAAGHAHTVALTATGEVLAWGANAAGELGNGTTTASGAPVTVLIPDGVTITDVEAGPTYSLALTSDGRVLSWGQGSNGTLGTGTTSNRSVPAYVHLPDGVEVTAISAAWTAHAVTATGAVYGWGSSWGGEVGDGTTRSNVVTPVLVRLPTGVQVVDIATGGHTLALTATGTLLAWGGRHAELGTGQYDNGFDVALPTAVRGLPSGTAVVDIAAGSHSLALTSSGEIYAWGRNDDGQVGDGTTTTVTTPTRIGLPGASTARAVATGGSYSIAVLGNGTLVSWGANSYGELGDGSVAHLGARSLVPTAVCGITAQTLDAGSHVLALGATAETAPCAPTQVQASPGHQAATVSWQPPAGPVAVTGYTVTASTGATVEVAADATSVVMAGLENGVEHRFEVTAHSVAGTSPASVPSTPVRPGSNQALGWGTNDRGQLGDGTKLARYRPVAALVAGGVESVVAGSMHTLAVDADGRLLGWGENASFVLGDGTNVARPTPIVVPLPAGVAIAQAAAGVQHGLALAGDGRLFGWGWCFVCIGDGSTSYRRSPVEVPLPDGVTLERIAAGGWGSLALANDGRLLAWGQAVGNGSTTNHGTPQAVALPGDTVVTDLSVGYYHRLVATDTGAVYGWGVNSDGQVGDGSATSFHATPVEVAIPDGDVVTQVAAGRDHSLALTDDGRVLAWGRNTRGQLGTGTTTDSRLPVEVALPEGSRIAAIAAGDYFSVAITTDERLLAWGHNLSGQLGTGSATTVPQPTPLPVSGPAGAVPVDVAAGQGHAVVVTAPAPGAPIDVSAEPLDGAARVSWAAADGGGAAIREYVVEASDGTTVTVTGDPAPTTALVEGLTNDVAHTFTVTAVSRVGAGPASAPSAAVIPRAGTPTEGPIAPPAPPADPSDPVLDAPTVSWSTPMATSRRALLGGTLGIAVSGSAGLAATATVEHLSWYDGGTLLEAPTAAATVVDLVEDPAAPGTYRGAFHVGEGTAELTRVTGTLTDGTGRSGTAAADRASLPVSGALAVDVVSDAELAGGRLVATSTFHVTGGQAAVTAPGQHLLIGLVPAGDYVVRLLESDGRLAGELTDLQVHPGRTTPASLPHVPRAAVAVAVVDGAGQPLADARVVFTSGTGVHLGSAISDHAGLADGPVVDRGTVVVATSTLPWNALPIERTASTTTTLSSTGTNRLQVQHAALAGGTVTGRVLRFDGEPAVNAAVTVAQTAPDGRHVTFADRTDGTGTYQLRTLAGPASVNIVYRYQTPQQLTVTVTEDGTDAGDLRLPEEYAYDVALELRTRYLGEALEGPHPIDWATATLYGLRVEGPAGSFTPRASTVRVVASPGDPIRFCANGDGAQLPDRCASELAPAGSSPNISLDLQLEQEGVAESVLTTTDGQVIGAWSASLYRVVDGARRPAGTAQGWSPTLSIRVPAAGDYELDIAPAGWRSRTVAFTAGPSERTQLGTLGFGPAGGVFSGAGNTVTALRAQTPPGGTVTFRVAYVVPTGGATGAVLALEVPTGTTVLDRSVVRDGALVADAAGTAGRVDVALGDLAAGATGVVQYALRLDDVPAGSTVAVQPRMRFTASGTVVDEVVGTGSTRVTGVTLEAPRTTASRDLVLTGRAPAGAELALYDGAVLVATTTASAGGYWRQPVTLHDRGPHARHVLHAETTASARVLRSRDGIVEFDADRPHLIEVAVQQPDGSRVVFDPRDGVARFPYVWKPDVPMRVEARFSAPDRVSNVVAHIGEATATATRTGDVFVASVAGTGRGGIGVEFDVVPPTYGFDEQPPSLDELWDRLPAGFAGAASTLPEDGGANVPGANRAVVVTQLPSGGTMRTEMTLSDLRDYTPTAQDDELVHASGVPFYNVQLESVPTADGGRDVTFRALVPEEVLGQRDLLAAAARLLTTGSVRTSSREASFAVASTHGAAVKKVAELVVRVAADKRTEAVFAAGTPIYDSEQAKAAGDKYVQVGAMYDDLSVCPPAVQTRFRGRLDGQLARAAGADIVGVALGIAGAVVAPATFGIGSVILWGIGAGAGLAIDASINGQIAKLRKELDAEGCGRDRPAEAGDSLAEPVWIHDPSGYVYEAVAANRLPDVTATVLFAEAPQGPWTVWDAAWFGQRNPLVTGADGRYAWDVPEGYWQVVYEKAGYLTGYSDVLRVLPPHFDVNEGLVSLAAPQVTDVDVSPTAVVVTFDRHVLAASVHGEHLRVASASGPVSGSVTVEAERSPDGTELTRVARFVPDQPLQAGAFEVTVDAMVQSYAGRPMVSDHVETVTVTVADPGDDDDQGDDDQGDDDRGDDDGSRYVNAGGQVTSDPRGVRPGVPTVTITSPRAGRVRITPAPAAEDGPAGLRILDVGAWDITAPEGSAADPLVLTFAVDRTDLSADTTRLTVLRDGRALVDCQVGTTRRALPCVAEHRAEGETLVVVVHTDHVSRWRLAEIATVSPACPDRPEAGFTDVPARATHARAIACTRVWDVTRGATASTYDPAGAVTRAQMASLLARALVEIGVELPASHDRFTDDRGSVHEQSIDQLAALGIVAGRTATSYAPDETLNRAQMATFLLRVRTYVLQEAPPSARDAFQDDDDSVHEVAIDQAAALGLAEGVSATRYAPLASVSRAQVASFLNRLLDSMVLEGKTLPRT